VDTALLLRRHQDGTRTVETVQRYGQDLPESVVAFDAETGTVTLAGTVAERRQAEAEGAALAAVRGTALTEPEVREATRLQATLVARAIRALVERGVLARSGGGRRGDPYRYSAPPGLSTSSTQPGSVEKSPRQDAENGAIFDSPPAPPYRVVGGESGAASSPSLQPTNGHGARCPVCGQAYALRATERAGWLQLRCRCEGGWRWCRADEPALKGRGLEMGGTD
jgi:hypothetical protein